MAPHVAIAMAVYNDAEYLRATLEALAAQTYSDFHLTIVDDESTDGSAEVAEGFAGRLPMTVVRAPHRGRQSAKRAASAATDPESAYLLVLDSDIVLPREALAEMVAELDRDPHAAAVSANARSATNRPWGGGQAFLDDLFLSSHTDTQGRARYIVGGCALFRRQALSGIEIRDDLGEDSDLSARLRDTWSLLLRRELVAIHLGVPTTLAGILKRFRREGVRVAAQLRIYPAERSIGNLARLVPLPLLAATGLGVALWQPWLAGGSVLLLGGYFTMFLLASRNVPAEWSSRLSGAFVFTVGNVGFGVGYLEELIRGRRGGKMDEPARARS